MTPMDWPDSEPDLPPYLKRYVMTWAGGLLTTWTLDGEQSAVPGVLEHRQETGLRYLADTVERVRFGGLTSKDLFAALSDLPECTYPSLLIGEVIDRLDHLSPADQGGLVRTLNVLHGAVLPSAARVWVDRALHRLLPRFSTDGSPGLAARCFTSDRVFRRRAAVKYYKTFGLDDVARQILVAQLADGEVQAPELVATDAGLVKQLGLADVLRLAPSTYYRKRAIELAMGILAPADLENVCRDYPQELVWCGRCTTSVEPTTSQS
jgi:hypothetical protein